MLNKKSIVFISYNAYPCVIGGLEIFNYYLLKELSKTNNIIHYTFCKDTKYSENVTVHRKNKSKYLKLTGPLNIFWFLLKNRKKIDLIHLSFSRDYWTHWLIFVLVRKLLGIKYMMTIHGGSMAEWKPKLPYELFFKNAEYITGVSERIVNEYSKRSRREIIYTPPLIPFEIITPRNKYRNEWGIDNNDKVLLYVGSLKPLKSVNTLIEALGLLSIEEIKDNNLKVLIAGDGISRRDLESRAIELGLQSTVVFLGNIDRSVINQLYNLADIYTICSEFEGLPISLLEAFANNLACISSDAPGLIDMSSNNQNTILFKTNDSQDYANKLSLILNDIDLQNKLKLNCAKYYEKYFSYDIMLNKFNELIDTV